MVVNKAFARRFLADTNPVGTSVNLAAGTGANWPSGRRPLLYGVEPNDWSALLTAVLALGAIGGIAGWIPARRAARVNPSTVLKST
jgi:hypothetical protein